MCSILCFIYSLEAWSSIGLCTTSIPNKNEPQLHSWDSVGENHKGSWECPNPSTWGGDPNKVDATKARLTIWESQAVPSKRYLSCWSVDIIKKASASHFKGYLSLAASFQGQPHFVLFTFCVTFPCALTDCPCQCCTLTKPLYSKSIIERKRGAIFHL